MTQRLSTAVVQDIAAIIDIIDQYPQDPEFLKINRIARERLGLNDLVLPPEPLPP